MNKKVQSIVDKIKKDGTFDTICDKKVCSSIISPYQWISLKFVWLNTPLNKGTDETQASRFRYTAEILAGIQTGIYDEKYFQENFCQNTWQIEKPARVSENGRPLYHTSADLSIGKMNKKNWQKISANLLTIPPN